MIEEQKHVEIRLCQLPPIARAAFAISCAERLVSAIPSRRRTEVSHRAHDTLAKLWPVLGDPLYLDRRLELITVRQEYDMVVADTGGEEDDDATLESWLERYAGEATYEALACAIDGQAAHAATAAGFVWSAIATYVAERDEVDVSTRTGQERVLRSEMMSQERAAEDEDFAFLEGRGPLTAADVAEIRLRCQANRPILFGV